MVTKKKSTKKKPVRKKTTRKKAAVNKSPTPSHTAALKTKAQGAPKKDGTPEDAVVKALDGKAWLLGSNTTRGKVEEVIPIGIGSIDHHILGVGGWAVGRASEVYSPEGTGKTSLMLKSLAGAQVEGGVAILAETEAALDPTWASDVHDVDIDRLVLIEPEYLDGEGGAVDLIMQAVEAIPSGVGPNLVALDSVAATPTKKEIEEGLTGKDKVAERAKHLSKACRMFAAMLKKHRVHLMFVNQVRDNIGVMFGDQYTTPGGHAVKFLASVRIQMLGGTAYKGTGARSGEHLGKDVLVIAAKNKLYPPWRKARVRLDYATGWDDDWSTLWLAKEKELVGARSRNVYEARTKLGWPVATTEAPL